MSSTSDKLMLLDACAVINLYATGQMAEILERIESRVGIASIVMQESLYVDGRDENAERERIDLSALVDSGAIESHSAETDSDLETFLDFAIELGDGEAMTLALAINRNAVVVTDDRKAIRLAADSLTIIPSLELIDIWFNAREISTDQQRRTLIAIKTRASYIPGRSHPYRDWWERIMDQS